MKRFFLAIMTAALMFMAAPNANAQDFNFDPAQMAQMRVDHMKETLKIDKDQSAKLLELFKKESDEMMKMFESGDFDASKMQENMKKQDEAVKKILTADQYKKYSEEQKKMREQFGGDGF